MAGNSAPALFPIEGEAPFVAAGKFIPICRAKPGAKVVGVVLNPAVLGLQCHYLDRRTFQCRARGGPCIGCNEGNRKRWQGYLPFLMPQAGRVGLAEITGQAAKDCPTFQQVGISLRGLWIVLERLGTSPRARVRCTFEAWNPTFDLPPPINTARALERVWGEPVHVAGLVVAGEGEKGGNHHEPT